MSDLPELPPPRAWVVKAQYPYVTAEPPMEGGLPRESLYTEAALLSFAREAMERGRRAGLQEAARIAQAQAETLAEEMYGHPREKAVEWAKEDKFDSQKDVANDLLSIVAAAIRSAGGHPALEATGG